jgi:sarcosine/dimethylglycine N-methyltransferase
MPDYQKSVNQQYGQADLGTKILDTLKRLGKDINTLSRDDLSRFDEFHIGGIAETRSLARMAGLRAEMHVLDVGSGLGGPARTLAAEFGCRVTGLDLTEEYCRAAEMLTARTGLSDQITFKQGNALEMPFEDSTFDVIWTQFVGMNIGDKERLYSEFRRVLKNGGILAFHEVMAGEMGDLHYPVFWANEPSLNFLKPLEEIRQRLTTNGFHEVVWKDLSQSSIEFFQMMLERARKEGPPALGFQVFVADSVPQKAANVVQNLAEKRAVVVQGVYQLKK